MRVFVGVGYRGYGVEAEEGTDWSESLGESSGGLPEPPVQRLISDHQGKRGDLLSVLYTVEIHVLLHLPRCDL